MRVHLDAGTCQGHNRCVSLAPEVFVADDIGQAILTVDDELSGDLRHRARLAAANCPEYAISITDRTVEQP